jgi:enoyl-CoA hydratase
MADAPRILTERRGTTLLVTLNAPERRNAIDQQMVSALHTVLDDHAADATLAAIVLTGAGDKAFAAGADIAQLRDRTAADARKAINSTICNRIEEFPVPVIAAIRGFALGGGCELALACDLRVLGESARMGQPEVKLGIIPGFGGTQRLARRVGVAKAKELCMTGDTIDAAEALRIGLADAVVPHGELHAKVTELAGRIAANGPLAVAEVKRRVPLGQSTTLEHAIALEQRSFGLLFATADQREGMSAFLAKPRRAPQFKGQ